LAVGFLDDAAQGDVGKYIARRDYADSTPVPGSLQRRFKVVRQVPGFGFANLGVDAAFVWIVLLRQAVVEIDDTDVQQHVFRYVQRGNLQLGLFRGDDFRDRATGTQHYRYQKKRGIFHNVSEQPFTLAYYRCFLPCNLDSLTPPNGSPSEPPSCLTQRLL